MFIIDELKHLPLNWTDGMRVGSKDFVATDTAWNDALRDLRVSVLQGRQFGLLPPLRDSDYASNYPKFKHDPARGVLTLVECRAITEGGYRVEITEDLFREHRIPAELPSATVHAREDLEVYITVSMDKKQPAGKLSPDAPPRLEYLCPAYELSILPRSAGVGMPGANHLKLAEFKWSDGKLMQDVSYLPACLTINTHPELLRLHQKAGANLKITHDNLVALVHQFRNDQRPNVRNATDWMERLALYLGSQLWAFSEELPFEAPHRTVVFFKNWMQYLVSSTDMYRENPFLEEGYKKQGPLFRQVASPAISHGDLRQAFKAFMDASDGLHRWMKAIRESFAVNRVVRVDEIR